MSLRNIKMAPYGPHSVLECLQGVGFKGKIALQKWSQTSRKLILSLDNMKKMSKKY